MTIDWEHYAAKSKMGTILRHATKKKFSFDLDNWIMLDRTGLITEVSQMDDIDFNKYAVKHPKTNQVDRELTIERFEKDFDAWIEIRTKDANKYKKAILSVFQQYPGRKVGAGMVENFALFAAGLEPNADNFETIRNAISQLIEAGVIERHGTKGKGAGLALATETAANDEQEEVEEVEEEPEPAPAPLPKLVPRKAPARR